ncbi:hypothetical protein RHSIM_Rhsim09G0201400 [Rhododendron simsii]|uniref:Reverse transcriptase Ty1/copia-type domain-containing protein n=1 Tax=Rhododendron simsii TaxID=118357 RepID=A0A834GIJ3_RHOSS|nr:hypothetical protein RHSIM_Rhsim09G0201400 [Rhododendron simsii]
MGVIHLPSRRDSRGVPREDSEGLAEVVPREGRLRKVRGQRANGSSTEDREGPAGVVAREDREAPEYFSLEDLPESSGDELGFDRMDEPVSRTEAVSRTESGAVPETGSSSPAAAESGVNLGKWLGGKILGDASFSSSPYDSALFIWHSSQGITLLLLYVDDMIIAGDDMTGITLLFLNVDGMIITGDDMTSIFYLKLFISKSFEMKDLCSLSYFLGLEISSDISGHYLSQAKYASDILACVALTDSKTASTPLEPSAHLTPLDGTLLFDPTLYCQLVGSLVYLTVTQRDIAYAIHLVNQFLSALDPIIMLLYYRFFIISRAPCFMDFITYQLFS